MYILTFILIFLFGAIIGSFLNVVIYRFNTGKSIVKGHSICMSCNKNLRWYELIPILSFLIQSGKCRRCSSRISFQYPLVEFLTGILFVLLAFHFLPLLSFSFSTFTFFFIFYAFIFSLLIVISFYDIRHKVIPEKLIFLFILFSFISIFISYSNNGLALIFPSSLAFLSGLIYALPFAILWLVSKGKWMGLGDTKLILGIGWILGITNSLVALVLAFWIGAIIGLALIFIYKNKEKHIGLKTEIPFAPFLIIATLITFLFNISIISLLNLFRF